MIVFNGERTPSLRAAFLLKDYFWFIMASIICAMPVAEFIRRKCEGNRNLVKAYEWISGIMLIGFFILALSFVISGQNSPFLYGNF